ncbi:MAG: hypothetical protein AAF829_08430 [Pseudomonadota bacterium]
MKVSLHLVCLFLTVSAVSACGAPASDTETADPQVDIAVNVDPAQDTEGAQAEAILIADVEMGDIACYFILEIGKNQMASFDLCDPALAGTRHIPKYEDVRVQSPTCEGDPECTLSVVESLIVELSPIVENQP